MGWIYPSNIWTSITKLLTLAPTDPQKISLCDNHLHMRPMLDPTSKAHVCLKTRIWFVDLWLYHECTFNLLHEFETSVRNQWDPGISKTFHDLWCVLDSRYRMSFILFISLSACDEFLQRVTDGTNLSACH